MGRAVADRGADPTRRRRTGIGAARDGTAGRRRARRPRAVRGDGRRWRDGPDDPARAGPRVRRTAARRRRGRAARRGARAHHRLRLHQLGLRPRRRPREGHDRAVATPGGWSAGGHPHRSRRDRTAWLRRRAGGPCRPALVRRRTERAGPRLLPGRRVQRGVCRPGPAAQRPAAGSHPATCSSGCAATSPPPPRRS